MRWRGILGAAVCLPLAAEAETWSPQETADAPLMRENASWPRYLHDALGLPDWIGLAIEQRTRFEYLDPATPRAGACAPSGRGPSCRSGSTVARRYHTLGARA